MLLLFGLRLLVAKLQTLYREMGFTRVEFMQILPSALRKHSYQVDDDLITIQVANGHVKIHLHAEQLRKIALLALPYIPITINFIDLNQAESDEFLARFDLYYRRGGG